MSEIDAIWILGVHLATLLGLVIGICIARVASWWAKEKGQEI